MNSYLDFNDFKVFSNLLSSKYNDHDNSLKSAMNVKFSQQGFLFSPILLRIAEIVSTILLSGPRPFLTELGIHSSYIRELRHILQVHWAKALFCMEAMQNNPVVFIS